MYFSPCALHCVLFHPTLEFPPWKINPVYFSPCVLDCVFFTLPWNFHLCIFHPASSCVFFTLCLFRLVSFSPCVFFTLCLFHPVSFFTLCLFPRSSDDHLFLYVLFSARFSKICSTLPITQSTPSTSSAALRFLKASTIVSIQPGP